MKLDLESLSEDQINLLSAQIETWRKANKNWPHHRHVYVIRGDGQIYRTETVTYKNNCISMGNYYRTKEDAERAVKQLKAKERIRQYIRQHNLEFTPDWRNPFEPKHYLIYNYNDSFWTTSDTKFIPFQTHRDRSLGTPFWFKSADDANLVIKNCIHDLLILLEGADNV